MLGLSMTMRSILMFTVLVSAAGRNLWGQELSFSPTVGPLTVEIELTSDEQGPVLNCESACVILTNVSNRPLRLWRFPDGAADRIRLELIPRNGGDERIVTRDMEELQAPMRGSAEIQQMSGWILPQQRVRIPWFQLNSLGESGSASQLPELNTSVVYRIRVSFSSDGPPQLGGDALWRGTVRSEVFQARLAAKSLKLPLDYLERGYVNRAITMFHEDPDSLDHQSQGISAPLLVATRLDQPAAVEWLLQHDVQVNVRDHAGYSPLHLVNSPEIARMLLGGKADPNLRASDYSKSTPLQHVLRRMENESSEVRRRQLRAVAQLLIRQGATYDLGSAIRLDDLEQVRRIVIADPKLADEFEGGSPLRLAASLGQLEICRYLIDTFRVDVNDTAEGIRYPILWAALDRPEVVRLLLEKNADPQGPVQMGGGRTGFWVIGEGATLLHHAAEKGSPETITQLLDAGLNPFSTADAFTIHDIEQTALDVAAWWGNAANLRAIATHPSWRKADSERRQALLNKCLSTSASGRGFNAGPLATISTLIDLGADPNSGANGVLPLRTAASGLSWNSDVLRLLLNCGAKPDLFSATVLGDIETVARILKESPVEAGARSVYGVPALHAAVAGNQLEIVRLLLQHVPVDVLERDGVEGDLPGETALRVAALRNQVAAAELLLAAGAKVDAVGSIGSTPLHDAVRSGSYGMIQLLLARGANPHARDENGETPLDQLSDHSLLDPEQVRGMFAEAARRQQTSGSEEQDDSD